MIVFFAWSRYLSRDREIAPTFAKKFDEKRDNRTTERRLFYCHSPDGATTEQTHCCYGEWYNSSHLVLLISSFSLLAFRSQNQRMDGSWVCYGQLWEWCYFDIPWLDSLPRPLFLRRWGNCPKFCQKIWRCHRLVSCHNETAEHMKTGIYPFKSANFGENMQVSSYPF